jgi:hypothetical protein
VAHAKVVFRECIQDSQDYGSDDEHMVSRVFFSLEVSGKKYDGLYVDIKQAVGSSYETGPIEVGSPRGARYRGPFNHQAFSQGVEKYFRSLVGSGGKAIRVSGATNIRMRNNRLVRPMTIEFEVSGTEVAW